MMWSEWLKLDNMKWLLQTAAIPLTLAYISSQYQSNQTARQADEARLRLYTESLTKRDEVESGVRRGVFDKVLENYLQAQSLDDKLVALELISLNFIDSLDLSPFFWQLDRQIQEKPQRGSLRPRLERLANTVKDQQIATLAAFAAIVNQTVSFAELNRPGPLIDRELSYSDPLAPAGQRARQRFRVEVLDHQRAAQRVLVRVDYDGGKSVFWVDLFDFPMANSVRISKSERVSVVLKRYTPEDAQLTLIYFPAARSGVRDRLYLDGIMSDLLRKGS